MTYCNWFGIYMIQTQSWVCKTPSRHLPDTFQTPSRHLPDTQKYSKFWPIRGNWEKRNRLIKMSLFWAFINCFHSIPPQTLFRVTQTTPRHLSDTFQTTFRHSEAPGREGTSWSDYSNWILLVNWEKMNQPIKTILNVPSLEFHQLIWPDDPPSSIQSHQDTLLTPSRHLPDTIKSINVGVVRGIGRKDSIIIQNDFCQLLFH